MNMDISYYSRFLQNFLLPPIIDESFTNSLASDLYTIRMIFYKNGSFVTVYEY